MTDKILPQQLRMKMLVSHLPFCDPEACMQEAIKQFGDKPGVLGFCITANDAL